MTGRADLRLGISDVAPVVSCGSFSARAVVGEHLPITATVFREGHDAVAANVVWTPAGRDGRPPRFIRMAKFGQEPDRWLATVVPDREGRWTFRVEAWSDPLATWHHAVEVKVEAGQGAEDLANDLEEGARLLDRVAAEADDEHRGRRSPPRPPRCATPRWSSPRASRRRSPRRLQAVPARAPGAGAGHPIPALRGLGRPAAGALRLLVRVLPALGGPGRRRQGRRTARSPTRRTGCRPIAEHGLRRRLPAADPPDRPGQPQGPELHIPRRQPDRRRARRRRLPVGDRQRRGRARRRPPAARARWRTSAPSSPAPASWAWRWRWTSRCRPRPDHPWVDEHPEWFTTKPDGTIAYAENPPKKYQDIYPINFDNDPEGIYAECLRVIRVWIEAGVQDLPRRQPAHQAAELLALADLGGQEDRPRRAVPRRGVHPAGDDAPAGAHRVHPVLHVLHLAHRARRARGLRPRAGRRTRTTCGRTSS